MLSPLSLLVVILCVTVAFRVAVLFLLKTAISSCNTAAREISGLVSSPESGSAVARACYCCRIPHWLLNLTFPAARRRSVPLWTGAARTGIRGACTAPRDTHEGVSQDGAHEETEMRTISFSSMARASPQWRWRRCPRPRLLTRRRCVRGPVPPCSPVMIPVHVDAIPVLQRRPAGRAHHDKVGLVAVRRGVARRARVPSTGPLPRLGSGGGVVAFVVVIYFLDVPRPPGRRQRHSSGCGCPRAATRCPPAPPVPGPRPRAAARASRRVRNSRNSGASRKGSWPSPCQSALAGGTAMGDRRRTVRDPRAVSHEMRVPRRGRTRRTRSSRHLGLPSPQPCHCATAPTSAREAKRRPPRGRGAGGDMEGLG